MAKCTAARDFFAGRGKYLRECLCISKIFTAAQWNKIRCLGVLSFFKLGLVRSSFFLFRQQLIRQEADGIQQYFLVLLVTHLNISDKILQFFIINRGFRWKQRVRRYAKALNQLGQSIISSIFLSFLRFLNGFYCQASLIC